MYLHTAKASCNKQPNEWADRMTTIWNNLFTDRYNGPQSFVYATKNQIFLDMSFQRHQINERLSKLSKQ